MKNFNILIFEHFFPCLTFLWKLKQNISCNISFSLIIIDFEIISREFLSLVDLARIEAFCSYKLTEIIMVSKDNNLVFIAFQVMAPSFENFNNSQEFLVINLVANPGGDHFLREKDYKISFTNFKLRKI